MKLPAKQSSLIGLGKDMKDGAHTYQVSIGLKHHSETTLDGAVQAVEGAQKDFADSGAAQADASKLLTVADSNGKAFIGSARKVVTPYLGEKFSADWAALAFPNHSLAIPSKQDDRLAVLEAFQNYFTENPTHENADPKINVTAVRATAVHAALRDARVTFKALQSQTLTLKLARDAAVTALRDEITGTIGELTDVLPKDSPIWLAFGLPLPGASHVPERVEGLELLPGAAGEVHADWADTPRAERYHVEILIVGVDTEFRRVLTREESDATLTGLPTGKTVKIRVNAVNDAGEGTFSEELEITLA